MKFLKRYLGFILGMITVVLFQVLSFFPSIIEVAYTNGIYRLVRFVYAYTLYYFPFALMYIFIVLVGFIIIRHVVRSIRKINKIKTYIFLVNMIGWVVFSFYWLWGFNYAREDFDERIGLNISQPDENLLMEELVRVDSLIGPIRRRISENDTIPLPEVQLPKDFQSQVRRAQDIVIANLGEPDFARVRIRRLKPKGNLLRIKTAGVYFPFVLEGHIDDGLHNIEKPYVLAHEMAHANGFTDEGVCNFIGFITCVNTEDPFIQYSGWLEYESYLYRTLRRNHPERLKEVDYKRPVFIRVDLNAIITTLEKYPNISPKLRDLFYNNYLKAQGVHAGMKSYSQIIQLASSYRQSKGDFVLSK